MRFLIPHSSAGVTAAGVHVDLYPTHVAMIFSSMYNSEEKARLISALEPDFVIYRAGEVEVLPPLLPPLHRTRPAPGNDYDEPTGHLEHQSKRQRVTEGLNPRLSDQMPVSRPDESSRQPPNIAKVPAYKNRSVRFETEHRQPRAIQERDLLPTATLPPPGIVNDDDFMRNPQLIGTASQVPPASASTHGPKYQRPYTRFEPEREQVRRDYPFTEQAPPPRIAQKDDTMRQPQLVGIASQAPSASASTYEPGHQRSDTRFESEREQPRRELPLSEEVQPPGVINHDSPPRRPQRLDTRLEARFISQGAVQPRYYTPSIDSESTHEHPIALSNSNPAPPQLNPRTIIDLTSPTRDTKPNPNTAIPQILPLDHIDYTKYCLCTLQGHQPIPEHQCGKERSCYRSNCRCPRVHIPPLCHSIRVGGPCTQYGCSKGHEGWRSEVLEMHEEHHTYTRKTRVRAEKRLRERVGRRGGDLRGR